MKFLQFVSIQGNVNVLLRKMNLFEFGEFDEERNSALFTCI